MNSKLTGIAAALFLAVLTLWLSYYTVPEGYRGVIVRNGAVIGEAKPGLGFKLPFITSVVEMTVRTQKETLDKVAAYSKDIQQSENRISINYKLLPDRVLAIYSTVGTEYGETVVQPAIMRRVKEVYGQYSAAEIIAQRKAIGDAIDAALREDLAGRGVDIESVQIENIDFSDEYEKAAEASATAQAAVNKAKQELARIEVEARQQVAQASARAEATRATADAEAYATRAKGAAEASAITAKGQALRDNAELVQLVTAERWDGRLPGTMLGGAVPLLSLGGKP